MFRIVMTALTFLLLFASCGSGGGDGEDQITRSYGGTLTGNNCLTNRPQEQAAIYIIVFEDFSAGSPVRLIDQNEVEWTGTMLSSNSFVVGTAADSRFSITVTEITPSSADGSSITSCQEINGCCTTLTGRLARR